MDRLVGRSIQLDFSYGTIPINGKKVQIEREPRSPYIIEHINTSPMVNFYDTKVGNFTIQITQPQLINSDLILDHTQKCHDDT